MSQPPYGQPSPYQPPPYGQPPPPRQRPRTSTMAIVALVMAFICMPIGLILAIVALVQINNSEEEIGGQGLAIAALVLSLVSVAFSGILAAIAIPNFIRYQMRAKSTEARVMLGEIQTAQMAFRADSGRYMRLPPTPDYVPGAEKRPWPADQICAPECGAANVDACQVFDCLDVRADLGSYFVYACETTPKGDHMTCAALGDLDGDGRYSLYVLGTGDGRIVAPIPKFGGSAPACGGEVYSNQVWECTPGTY